MSVGWKIKIILSTVLLICSDKFDAYPKNASLVSKNSFFNIWVDVKR